MRLLVLDFETKDPYIGYGMGSGWVYAINAPTTNEFRVLGAAMMMVEDGVEGDKFYCAKYKTILEHVRACDAILCHNAAYDLGCLMSLGINPKLMSFDIIDTEVMSRLHNSTLHSHALDALAKKYLKYGKKNSALVEYAWESQLYSNAMLRKLYTGKVYVNKQPQSEDAWLDLERAYWNKLQEKELDSKLSADILKWCKSNMDIIQDSNFDVMAEYAIGDITPTYGLYKYFLAQGADMELVKKYSNTTKICCEYRKRGVKIDLDRAQQVHDELQPIIAEKFSTVYAIAGEQWNINSPKEMGKVFDRLKIKYPLSDKGNPSITSPWMSSQTHPVCAAIVEARQVLKMDRDFIVSVLETNKMFSPNDYAYGRAFPELNLLRARTGRFSCSNPNIQQIPSRSVYGAMCRSIFCADEGENWYSLDYSNQEGRLQVHYACIIEAEGAELLKLEFIEDPDLDLHQRVADLEGISRSEAKAVNLGISYGMGPDRLAKQLKISKEQARYLRERYNTSAPYLKQLNDRCKNTLETRGYVKTLGGRRLHIDPPTFIDGEKKTYEYKGLNKLIQGSAADQTIEAMIKCYEEGLPVLFVVHDQICMSGTLEQATRVKEIMETCVKLVIPVVVDYNKHEAKNWAEAGH